MAEPVLDLDALLAPISEEQPAGEDLSGEAVYDEIKEARRADDAYLAQGDWKTEVKVAEWPKVKNLASEAITTRSKDLQLAAWLTEALGSLHGFHGMQTGFELLGRLLSEYWDTLYPLAEDGDLDYRVGRLEWLAKNLPRVIVNVPMTAPQAGGFGWRHWKEARDVENLGRQSSEAMQSAIDEGKVSPEAFDNAFADTPDAFYSIMLEDVNACVEAFKAFDAKVDELFGNEAPGLRDIRDGLENCVKLAQRLASEKGLLEAPPADEATEEAPPGDAGSTTAAAKSSGPAGPPQNRDDALRRLAELAAWFKRNEPHSPVAYLVDRAVKWGKMPLENWLAEVVKDQTMLDSVRETLGLPPGTQEE